MQFVRKTEVDTRGAKLLRVYYPTEAKRGRERGAATLEATRGTFYTLASSS